LISFFNPYVNLHLKFLINFFFFCIFIIIIINSIIGIIIIITTTTTTIVVVVIVVVVVVVVVVIVTIVVVLLLFIIYTINLPVVRPRSCRVIYYFDTQVFLASLPGRQILIQIIVFILFFLFTVCVSNFVSFVLFPFLLLSSSFYSLPTHA
jgi:hypothetical protein